MSYHSLGRGGVGKNATYWNFAIVNNEPTYKQVQYFKTLYGICKGNGISTDIDFFANTREDYIKAINLLVTRLREAGIPIRGVSKNSEAINISKSGGENYED